ncbi:MAG: sugar transporter [Limnohabitans sp.]|jgi:polysaccharide export outer membrane protein|nr:MAG: sugar transporter [Limnohabitans sp.]
MNFFRCRFLPLLAFLFLSGCAMAPGFYTGKGTTFNDPEWLPNATTGGSAQADAPPSGALISITPELLRQQRALRKDDISAEVKQLFGTPKPYTIGSGDILNIVVWDHPQLAIAPAGAVATVGSDGASAMAAVGNGYNVSPEGQIQFPYVGQIKLAGLTEYQARDLITQTLAKVIKDPQVTLRIQSYRSGRVYIDGEVRNPGLQFINDIPLTLPEAIGRAGGYSPLADRSAIAITRNGVTTTVSLPQLTAKGINPAQILLGNGDLVRVQGREEAKVFVLGEVLRPLTQTLRNGRLTLNEALGEAGGVNPNSGDPRQIYVVRTVNPDQPEIYHLDAKSPMAYALAEGFELQARDVVYVDPVPLVRWNRVISLVLPSAQAVTTTRTVSGN